MPQVLLSALLGLFLFAGKDTFTFPTSPPELSKGAGIVFPMEEAQYAKFAEQAAKMPSQVVVRKRPKNLTAQARYGYNFVVGGKNRGWILDGNEQQGWVLYLDWKGDGDLSGAAPQKMEAV